MSSIPAAASPAVDPFMEEIADTTLGSAAASISFSGISTDYRLFQAITYILKDGTGGNALLRINNDSGANYDDQRMTGIATSVSAGRGTGQTSILVVQVGANTAATAKITVAKQLAGSAGMVLTETVQLPVSDISTRHTAGRWINAVDFINQIDLVASASNFDTGSTATLNGDRSS